MVHHIEMHYSLMAEWGSVSHDVYHIFLRLSVCASIVSDPI